VTENFTLPLVLDFGATFIWSVSGALVAARQRFDLVGLSAIALVSSTGGGLMRDGLFLQSGPPALVQTPWYIAIALVAALLIHFLGRKVQHSRNFTLIVGLFDALGLGAYAVIGMQKSLLLGLSVPGVVLVGLVNAVGGGVLRDVLVGREPLVFKPGTLNAIAALAGCACYLGLTDSLGFSAMVGAWSTIALTFAIRAASVRFNIQTTASGDFDEPPTRV